MEIISHEFFCFLLFFVLAILLIAGYPVALTLAGVSILIVEQNARRSLEISSRGYVLDQGRNAYSGLGKELLNDEKVIELYLGKM